MQNLAWLRTTSKFGGEYLKNGWRYSKSNFYFVYRDFFRVSQSTSGKVYSSDLGDLDVESTDRKRIFRKTIFRPRGAARPNFYTR